MGWQHNRWYKLLSLTLLLVSISISKRSISNSIDYSGYIGYIPTLWINADDAVPGIDSRTLNTHQINNRVNLYGYYDELTMEVGMRNIANYGSQNREFNDLLESNVVESNQFVIDDPGYLDLTWVWHSNNDGYTITTFDRLSGKVTLDKLEASIGRQRINWGINGIWEPNDIFNTFSYLDVYYPERPGADSIRVLYYLGPTSNIDIAYKVDSGDKATAGGLYKTLIGNYDIQFMVGSLNGNYHTLGGGFSGEIVDFGFVGEFSYYNPIDSSDIDTPKEVFLGSAGFNYFFYNEVYWQGSILYNSSGSTAEYTISDTSILPGSNPSSALDYTNSRMQLFTSISSQINPLTNIDISTIINPYDKSFYLAPSTTYSLSDNWDLYIIAQTFWGDKNTEFGELGQIFSLNTQYNF